MSGHGRYARLRIGDQELAVASDAVAQAVLVESPRPLPRRSGALASTCDTPWGVVPLLDLALWLDMGHAATPGHQALLLRNAGKAVAVRVSSLHGVAAAASVSRLHHDDDPSELFQSCVRWVGAGSAALLEVERLLKLTQVWCEDSALSWGGLTQPGGASSLQRQPHAILSAGGVRWAIPAQHLLEVAPAKALEFALPPGSHARGICSWRARKMPVLDLAALRDEQERTTDAELWAVVCSGELSAAILVNEARQLVQLEVPSHTDQFEPAIAPDGSEVLWVDVERLLCALPEAGISRGGRAADPGTASAASCPHAAGAASYLLFEADTTYAAPVGSVVQVVALDPATMAQLLRGGARLSFQGQSLPLFPLPAYSGQEATNPPQVAFVVAMPDGALAAIAVHRVTAWAQGAAVQPGAMRAAAFGEFQTITVTRSAQRTTHMVIDLDQVAYMLA